MWSAFWKLIGILVLIALSPFVIAVILVILSPGIVVFMFLVMLAQGFWYCLQIIPMTFKILMYIFTFGLVDID